MMPARLAALIFDVDGTLADTERDGHRPAFNRAFAEAGLDWHWSVEEYGRLLRTTGGKERMRGYHAENPIKNININDIDSFIANLHKDKNRAYAEIVGSGGIPLRPGVARLVGEARDRGVRLAIATTTTRSNVVALLEATLGPAALDWFELIATADEVPDKKPSPAVYQYVLDALHLTADDCVALEDSRNGVRSAHAAGLPVIVTVNDYTRNDDMEAAELIVDQLGEPDAPLSVLGGSWAGRIAPNTACIDIATLEALLHG
jgi:HAD superfamily hydrolase (TIGR01509 family)